MADSLDDAIEAKFGHKKPAKFQTNENISLISGLMFLLI